MKKHSKIIGTLLASVMVVSLSVVTVAFAEGQFGERVAARQALESGDYASWQETAGPQMLAAIDTEEKFNRFLEAHEMIQNGDIEGAKTILDELGVPVPPRGGMMHGGMMHEGMQDMRDALDDNDYEAWALVAPDFLKEKINENNFDQLVEAHNLMQEGNFEEAEAIFDSLSLERAGNMMGRMGMREDVREAVENADYSAWQEVAGTRMLEVIDTEEKFNKLVEAHNLRESGDNEGAQAIMDELGMQSSGQTGNRMGQGMGKRMGQ